MKKKLIDSFIFDSYSINPESKQFKFRYRLRHGAEESLFEEVLQFPTNLKWNKVNRDVLSSALEAIHLALGVSYWKAYCPKDILLPEYALSKDKANFWNKLYSEGLGEFFYRNKIDFRKLIEFPFSKEKQNVRTAKVKNNNRSLLLFGGGKDSLTSAEIMKSQGKKFTYFYVATGKRAGVADKLLPKDAIVVERFIDPKLFELNSRKEVYNGHIPISALISFIAELAAILYGYRYVVISNERSANYGNVRYLGREINHQWSKSIEFEHMLQDYTHGYITRDITQFSILRPYYEIKVVQMFSRYPKYFKHFTSCNRHFRVIRERPKELWCGECPKCVFVFSLMSVFIPKARLLKIFGKNMFDDRALLPIFKELLGLKKFKPFECVGTPEEMVLALFAGYRSGEYKDTPVMKMFEKEVLNKNYNILKIEKDVMVKHREHLIPKEFNSVLENI